MRQRQNAINCTRLLTDAAGAVRIWAEHSPFDLKDELKKRGYRWSSGDDGRPKAWYVDIDESLEADEIRYLCDHIYRRDVDLFTQIITAVERFSVRA